MLRGKLRPCPSYSRRRDRINLGLWRSLYKGGRGTPFFFHTNISLCPTPHAHVHMSGTLHAILRHLLTGLGCSPWPQAPPAPRALRRDRYTATQCNCHTPKPLVLHSLRTLSFHCSHQQDATCHRLTGLLLPALLFCCLFGPYPWVELLFSQRCG